MPSESAKLSAFQLASLLSSYAGAIGYGSPYQLLAEQLADSAKGSIMAQAQLVAQKRAKPKGFKKIVSDIAPIAQLGLSIAGLYGNIAKNSASNFMYNPNPNLISNEDMMLLFGR